MRLPLHSRQICCIHQHHLSSRLAPIRMLQIMSQVKKHMGVGTSFPFFVFGRLYRILDAHFTSHRLFYPARLVAVPGGSIGENLCVTSLASPSTTQYVYLHLATCGSNISPPPSQSFVLETNDFGHEITFVSIYSSL